MQANQFNRKASKLVVDIAWSAWNRLGLYGRGGASRYSTDIESSIVLAAFAGWVDARLLGGVMSWLVRYLEIVNGERLKVILKGVSDPFATRCVGAMLETAFVEGGSKRLHPLLDGLRKELPSRAPEPTAFVLSRSRGRWIEEDPIFAKWGLAREASNLGDKLWDHEWIIRNNLIVRYRYLFGVSARADIVCALQLLASEGKPADTAMLSSLLGYNHSSVFRVMKDFERGGYVDFSGTKRSQKARWQPPSMLAPGTSDADTRGYLDWMSIISVLIKLMVLSADGADVKNELVVKHGLFDLLKEFSAVVSESGLGYAPPFPAEPLASLSLEDVMEGIISLLSGVADEINPEE